MIEVSSSRIERAFGPAGEFIAATAAAAETGTWLYQKWPYIRSYLDQPKSLDELQQAVRKPRQGYNIHHIVEQTPACGDGFSEAQIEGLDNLVSIPTLKHWEITGWYLIGNDDFGGLSPRDYLKGKSWDERHRVGLDALYRFKVLKQ